MSTYSQPLYSLILTPFEEWSGTAKRSKDGVALNLTGASATLVMLDSQRLELVAYSSPSNEVAIDEVANKILLNIPISFSTPQQGAYGHYYLRAILSTGRSTLMLSGKWKVPFVGEPT